MHLAAENENESAYGTPGYDLSMDHPGYSLPITNISYTVDPRERQHARCEAMAKQAFQNIMDSYEEYERMTDVFQLEHERREQHERELKEERLRLRRQQKSKKKTGKQGKRKKGHHCHCSCNQCIDAHAPMHIPPRIRLCSLASLFVLSSYLSAVPRPPSTRSRYFSRHHTGLFAATPPIKAAGRSDIGVRVALR